MMPCRQLATRMRFSFTSPRMSASMRLTVRPQSLVCSVAITRCPVSAALRAISIVSSSRISPTKMTSGSCRSAARKCRREARRVDAHLALRDAGHHVVVQKLDGVLHRDDVKRPASC